MVLDNIRYQEMQVSFVRVRVTIRARLEFGNSSTVVQ